MKDIVVNSRWTAAYRFLAVAMSGFGELRWDQRARIVTRFFLGDGMDVALESIGMVRERNMGEENGFQESDSASQALSSYVHDVPKPVECQTSGCDPD